MNCDDFQKSLQAYYHGKPGPEVQPALAVHARDCPACATLKLTAEELSCKEFVEFLNDYVDGELPAERRSTFERHLGICPDCTKYLESYRRTMQLSVLALGQSHLVPEPIPEGLVAAILAARKAK